MSEFTNLQAESALDAQNKHKDEEIKSQLEQDGWQLAGQEYPFMTPLNKETCRFEPVRILSEEEIKEKYLTQYSQHGFSEVRIEVSHHIQTGWPNESMVYVYMRRPEDVPAH